MPAHTPDRDASFELVRRACAGDREAENRLAARYLPRLTRWARGRLPRGARTAMETGDLVQEVLIRAIGSFHRFEQRHEGSFPAFVRRILANRLHDLGRAERRRPPLEPLEPDVDLPSGDATPFDAAVGVETRARFERAFARLSIEEQELIFMRLELGYGYDDIAAMVGRPTAAAVRIAARRAMLHLAEEMTRDQPRP